MVEQHPGLLGRNRIKHDERDFPLEAWHEGATPLEMALAAVKKSWSTAPAVKKFCALVTTAIEGGSPAPTPTPTPAPTPSPTPTPTPAPGPVNGIWPDNDVRLDQLQTGHCVGFGGATWENTLPIDDHATNDDGHNIYYLCKILDGEPNQENGSTVHSLAKVLQQKTRLNAYAWATDTKTVAAWVSTKGPIVIGIDWTNGMFTPDENNFIAPTGGLAGGHCLNIVGYDPVKDAHRLRNSWGPTWGDNGEAWITSADLQKLLDGLVARFPGEAMAAIELAA